jgi:precorrin-6A/cobalt-precorrin-6A reductase
MRVLILGGTTEARQLKDALGNAAVLALKRTTAFGGAQGLNAYVEQHAITHIVDATHPFATRISANATQTTAKLIRLERPPFERRPEYTYVDSLLAADIPLDARVFLTTGHHELEAIQSHPAFFLIRAITPPQTPLPPRHELLLDKGPFTFDSEVHLIRTRQLTLLISKDSGGPHPKIRAAIEEKLPVILISRPNPAQAPLTVPTVEEALVHLSD